MKKLFIFICTILLVIAAMYFIKPILEATKGNKEVSNTTSPPSNSENPPPTKAEQTYSIGDTVKVGDVEVTIQNATLGNPDPYAVSKNGKVLTIELRGTNNGTNPLWLNYNDFELQDVNQNKSDYYVGGSGFMPVSAELKSGDNISGKIKFDVKSSYENYYHLYYTPNFISDKKVHWTIKVQ